MGTFLNLEVLLGGTTGISSNQGALPNGMMETSSSPEALPGGTMEIFSSLEALLEERIQLNWFLCAIK